MTGDGRRETKTRAAGSASQPDAQLPALWHGRSDRGRRSRHRRDRRRDRRSDATPEHGIVAGEVATPVSTATGQPSVTASSTATAVAPASPSATAAGRSSTPTATATAFVTATPTSTAAPTAVASSASATPTVDDGAWSRSPLARPHRRQLAHSACLRRRSWPASSRRTASAPDRRPGLGRRRGRPATQHRRSADCPRRSATRGPRWHRDRTGR